MNAQEKCLIKTLNELKQKSARNRFLGVRLEQLCGVLISKAKRPIDTAQVVVTLAALIKSGEVEMEHFTKRVAGPDSQREQVPHFRIAL